MANSNAGGGIGFGGLLTIVFIVLKLTDVISWSWWWVVSPVLIPLGLGAVICAVGILGIWLKGLVKGR